MEMQRQYVREISKGLNILASGNYHYKLSEEGPSEEWNVCKFLVNRLADELRATTVSRNYLKNVLNSVSDMVFILSKSGNITDINHQVERELMISRHDLLGKALEDLQPEDRPSMVPAALRRLRNGNTPLSFDTFFIRSDEQLIPIRLTISWLYDGKNRRVGMVVNGQNISQQIETENRILRAMIDTEEKERKRMAKDMHDSLGQKMSGINLYLAASAETCQDPNVRNLLESCQKALSEASAEMRALCFALMPETLQSRSLLRAIREIFEQPVYGSIRCQLLTSPDFPTLEKSVEIDVYRVVQEFLQNAVKHGKADRVALTFDFQDGGEDEGMVRIRMKDFGSGFNPKQERNSGMGISNMESRIRSHRGRIQLRSAPGKGTEITIHLPVNVQKTADT